MIAPTIPRTNSATAFPFELFNYRRCKNCGDRPLAKP